MRTLLLAAAVAVTLAACGEDRGPQQPRASEQSLTSTRTQLEQHSKLDDGEIRCVMNELRSRDDRDAALRYAAAACVDLTGLRRFLIDERGWRPAQAGCIVDFIRALPKAQRVKALTGPGERFGDELAAACATLDPAP